MAAGAGACDRNFVRGRGAIRGLLCKLYSSSPQQFPQLKQRLLFQTAYLHLRHA